MKQNCWEFKQCGRELEGKAVSELGTCSAATEERMDGIHGGKNGGRTCWAVAGTLCGGEVQGTFAQKMLSCKACDFYRLVKEDEGSTYQPSLELVRLLKA